MYHFKAWNGKNIHLFIANFGLHISRKATGKRKETSLITEESVKQDRSPYAIIICQDAFLVKRVGVRCQIVSMRFA